MYDTLPGRNYAIMDETGHYRFEVPYEGWDVSACLRMCEADYNCHGMVTMESTKTCYFRGGLGAEPSILDAEKVDSEDNKLWIIFGMHNAPPLPPKPPPPPFPPDTSPYDGVFNTVLLLLLAGGVIAVGVYTFASDPELQKKVMKAVMSLPDKIRQAATDTHDKIRQAATDTHEKVVTVASEVPEKVAKAAEDAKRAASDAFEHVDCSKTSRVQYVENPSLREPKNFWFDLFNLRLLCGERRAVPPPTDDRPVLL